MNKLALLPMLLLTACAHHVDQRYERREVYGQPPVERYERREVYRPAVVRVERHEDEHERRDDRRMYPTPVYPANTRPVVQPAPYPVRPAPQVVQPYPVVQPRPVTVMQPVRPSVQPAPVGRAPLRNNVPHRDGGHGHHH